MKKEMINKKRENNHIIFGNVSGLSKYNKDNNLIKSNNNYKSVTSISDKKILFVIFFALVLISLSLVSAQATNSTNQVSFCCEKTTSGAYCQNAPLSQCDQNFRSTPTSCEATSFCKKGCCYDSNQGICMENSPQQACTAANGLWSDSATCTIPQCDLGCCVLGQQAAYVPLARCKKLASLYGLQTDFRKDVTDELSCINLAQAQDTGACVYESDFVTTCKFTTRGQCVTGNLKSVTNSTKVNFYKDYLCTNPQLGTDCQPLDKTTCASGKDSVYFVDSCGNTANIYDASKLWSTTKSSAATIEYWSKVIPKEQSCGSGGNIDSKSCGNCDYLSGSICSTAQKSDMPSVGNFICQDINCAKTSDGQSHKNGESWCFYDNKNPNSDSAGSIHYRHVCIMGQEQVEQCDAFREKVCVQSSINGFSQAGCVANRWQDCILQNSSDDCMNTDKRDCQWISTDLNSLVGGPAGLTGQAQQTSSSFWSSIGLGGSLKSKISKNSSAGKCVAKIAPGLQFWDSSSEAQCKLGNQKCVVTYESDLFGNKKCVSNCDCLTQEAKYKANQICNGLGDCGAKANYIGVFVDKGYKITVTKGQEQSQTSAAQPAQPSTTSTTTNSPAPPSGSQTFGGSGGGNTFGGSGGTPAAGTSSSSSPTTKTGSVIQGLVVGTYNKIVGGK